MRALALTIVLAITGGLLVSCAHAPTPNAPAPGLPGDGGRPQRGEDGRGPVIRVSLASGADAITVSADGTWHLAVDGQREAPARLAAGESRRLEPLRRGQTRVGGAGPSERSILDGTVLVYPDSPSALVLLNGRPYRGYLVVVAGDDGLDVVNRLRLEDYLRSVVPAEIGKGSPSTQEALKAQAVASRTYAYRKCERRAGEAFDVQSGILDQVYSGAGSESPATDRACRETAGQIVCVDGHPVEALYASTCGGRTASPAEAWSGGNGGAHLASRLDHGRDGDFCAHSRHYRWEVTWEAADLEAILATHYPRMYPSRGRPLGRVVDMKIVDRGPSGRVTALEVVTTTGRHLIERDTIRWTLRQPDGSPLRSTWFDLQIVRRGDRVKTVTARGRGSGHGVGMCQTGAIGMSERGYRYFEILGHYYRGVELRQAY